MLNQTIRVSSHRVSSSLFLITIAVLLGLGLVKYPNSVVEGNLVLVLGQSIRSTQSYHNH